MRVAIISDIHGNLAAFEAVLDHIATQQVDQVVINGDIINTGPDSLACLELAYRTGYPMLAGNHERYIHDFDQPSRALDWTGDIWRPSLWTAEQLGAERRAALHDLPTSLQVDADLLIVHASLRHDQDSVFAATPNRELNAMFPGDPPRTIVRSHNHMPQFRPWGLRMIVTTGAVGQPLDGNPWAKYALAERHADGWQIKHRVVPYDIEATVRRFRESGYLEWAAPVSRLYLREMAIGTHHIVPFIRLLTHWREHDPALSTSEAVRRFLDI